VVERKHEDSCPEHYALVTKGEMADRHADATWHGFVEPLGYGVDYADLPNFLLKHFPAPTTRVSKNKRDPVKVPASNSKHARLMCLALLALPGGGKTLLLKRLAVAYADSARRLASEDALPDLDLVPVLIRCREWREHMERPILTLLRNLPDITGQAHLTGLSDALLPLLRRDAFFSW
jgi:hypothetical protein